MKKVISFLLAAVMLVLCSGCTVLYSDSPTVESIDNFVTEHYEIITIVADYLLSFDSIDYQYIFVNDNKSLTLYWSSGRKPGGENIKIEDDDVLKSITVLRQKGCTYITKDSRNNAITFEIWARILGEADCCFGCPIDPTKEPQIEYQTEIVPLSKENWYYLFSDYEKWRVQNR